MCGRSGEMKCYYCQQVCEGLVFEQGNFSIVAHRDCALKKLEKDCDLIIRRNQDNCYAVERTKK